MNAELDYDLTQEQWKTLRALRIPAPERQILDHSVVAELVALELAAINGGLPCITTRGRSVLLRGSPRLLDLAACELTILLPE
jgi:hypothetical protein